MKKIGIIILIVGLGITLITGFKFITREKVADIGNIKISRDKTHAVKWSPILGIALMSIGGGVFLFGLKKR